MERLKFSEIIALGFVAIALASEPAHAQTPPPEAQPQVFGGAPVAPGEFPSLLALKNGGHPECSAIVLSPYCAITSSSCVHETSAIGDDPNAIDLNKTGEIRNMTLATSAGETRVAKSIPNSAGAVVGSKDIAILRTEKPIFLTPTMKSAKFPEATLPVSTSVKIAGYGSGAEAQRVDAQISACPTTYADGTCATETNGIVTGGDGGAPIITKDNPETVHGILSGITNTPEGVKLVFAPTTATNEQFIKESTQFCAQPSFTPDNFITDNQGIRVANGRTFQGITYAVIDNQTEIAVTDKVTDNTHDENPTSSGIVIQASTNISITDPNHCIQIKSFEPTHQNLMTTTQTSPNTYDVATSGDLVPFNKSGQADIVQINTQTDPTCHRKSINISTSDSQISYAITKDNQTKPATQQGNNLENARITFLSPIAVPSIQDGDRITLTNEFAGDEIRLIRYQNEAVIYNNAQHVNALKFPNGQTLVLSEGETNRIDGFGTHKSFMPTLVR